MPDTILPEGTAPRTEAGRWLMDDAARALFEAAKDNPAEAIRTCDDEVRSLPPGE